MASDLRVPTSDASAGSWTASAGGSLYACVDEGSSPSDTDYISVGTNNNICYFGFSAFAVPAGATSISVSVIVRAKNIAGTTSTEAVLRIGSTNYLPGSQAASGSYTDYTFTWSTNPATSAAWTVNEVNSSGANSIANFGVESRSVGASETVGVSNIYIQVTYTPAAGGVTCTPGTASLTLTKYAPTVSTPQTVTPGVKSLSLSTFAPSAIVGVRVIPGTTALVLTKYAPTVSTPVVCTPGVLALTTTAYAPVITVNGDRTATPGTATLTLTTYAPSVLIPMIVTPDPASLTLTGYAPTVSSGLPADSSLVFSVVAGSQYRFHILVWVSKDASGDFTYDIGGAAATLVKYTSRRVDDAGGLDATTVRTALGTPETLTFSGAGTAFIEIDGYIQPSASGNVSFRWFRGSGIAVLKGSTLDWLKVA